MHVRTRERIHPGVLSLQLTSALDAPRCIMLRRYDLRVDVCCRSLAL
jgi:hypothetical protein